MTVLVALLRGINVGGHNSLPMKQFRELLEALDCRDVTSYIQSGNAVFTYDGNARSLSDAIATAIEEQHGFRPSVLVISATEFSAIANSNPYLGQFRDPKLMHVAFLQRPAKNADIKRMTELAADDESFELAERAFYLHAPSGIGRSKLAAGFEKCLGVSATSRNWRSVEKLQSLVTDKLNQPN